MSTYVHACTYVHTRAHQTKAWHAKLSLVLSPILPCLARPTRFRAAPDATGELDSPFSMLNLIWPESPPLPDRSTGQQGRTPLHDAAWNGHLDVVDAMLNRGAAADADVTDVSGLGVG